MLDIEDESMTPTELISAMLKAQVDLLWNGGIGTYVKASFESNAEVGDRANDALRVDGERARMPRGRGGWEPRVHADGTHRVRAARAVGSTWTPSTTPPVSTAPTTR